MEIQQKIAQLSKITKGNVQITIFYLNGGVSIDDFNLPDDQEKYSETIVWMQTGYISRILREINNEGQKKPTYEKYKKQYKQLPEYNELIKNPMTIKDICFERIEY